MNFLGWIRRMGRIGSMLAVIVFGLQWAGIPAWAQKATHQNPAPLNSAPQQPATQASYLDRMLRLAEQDLAIAEPAYEAEVKKGRIPGGPAYDACLANRLFAEVKNARWMREHRAELEALNDRFAVVPREVWAEPIRVPALPGQSVQGQVSREILIGLPTIQEFIQVQNERLRTSSDESKKALLEQLNNPLRNRIQDARGVEVGVGMDQIKQAIERMAINANGTIKEREDTYRLQWVSSETGFDLRYEVTTKDEKLKDVAMNFSLLKGGDRPDGSYRIDEDEIWPHLMNSRLQIAGASLSGRKRLMGYLIEEMRACEEVKSYQYTLWAWRRWAWEKNASLPKDELYFSYEETKEWGKIIKSIVRKDGVFRVWEEADYLKSAKVLSNESDCIFFTALELWPRLTKAEKIEFNKFGLGLFEAACGEFKVSEWNGVMGLGKNPKYVSCLISRIRRGGKMEFLEAPLACKRELGL